jgi:serine/threonine protein kinase
MYGCFDDATHLYIVLEYMEQGTLYSQLKRGVICEKEAATIIKQITESLEYLHDMGIAHRDLKP